MTAGDKRDLDKIAAALTPKQAFLLWLTEAQQHESWAAHVMSLREQPIDQHPMQRLPHQVEQGVRTAHKGEKEDQLWPVVKRAVREVAFYYELHVALTSRLAVEWRAVAFEVLLSIEANRRLLNDDAVSQVEIDRARQWVVGAFGDVVMWQQATRSLSDRFVDGRSLLFPDQDENLRETGKTTDWLVEHFNDHMQWLAFLREPERKGKKAQPERPVDLAPIDVDAVRGSAEREATATADQLVVMAKAEAATFVGEKRLAAELLDQVWVGVCPD